MKQVAAVRFHRNHRLMMEVFSDVCVPDPRTGQYTMEPPYNGHIGDKHFVHCSEVVPSSEVEMYG